MVTHACPSCGKQNRVPAEHLAHEGRCGHCKTPLPPLDAPLEAGPELFGDILAHAKVPVLVDFWAEWCGPCRMAAPHVAKVAANMAGQAVVLKVDTEAHPELAARFGVRGIPNFVVINGGELVHQQAGLVDHRMMEQWLRDA